jgi:nucleoside-diphosphate-sugar epimerase
MPPDRELTVAVTGPTGTFGAGLVPLLEADDRIGRVVGVARREFDPASRGWSKLEYQRGDVRDRTTLERAFRGADVVVHLAFLVMGGDQHDSRAINVEGTLNAFRAAASAGVRRFVYASSVAAYGFHRDNPVGMTEDWPARPARALSYAQEKAELEGLLAEESRKHPDVDLFLLRPPIVVGPHAVGAKGLPGVLAPLGGLLAKAPRRLPVPLPGPVPDLPLQLIHEDDVGTALLACVVGDGPPGAYNIAADDVLSIVDVARELGVLPVPIPGGPVRAAARAVSRLPALPAAVQWVEAVGQPAIMDTTRAKELLGWSPQVSALEALRQTLSTR